MRRPPLTLAVCRGLEHWLPVMDTLLTVPDDSELQTLTADELKDAQRSAEYLNQLLHWFTERSRNNPTKESPHGRH